MGDLKTSDILAMSVEQRLDLIERVWDTLAATPERVPIPAWHIEAIDKALEAHEREPKAGDDWDTVKKRLSGQP